MKPKTTPTRKTKAVKAWVGMRRGRMNLAPFNYDGAWSLRGLSVYRRRSDAAQIYEVVIPVLISPLPPSRRGRR